MALLGFDAIGQFALGQIGPLPPTLPFSRWESSNLKTKNAALQVTQSFVAIPVVRTTAVFTKFSEPLSKKQVIHNQGFVTRPVAQVVTVTPVFTSFSQPSFQKVRQQSNTNSSFFVAPAATTVVVGGDFTDWDLIQTKKQQQGFTNFTFVPPVRTLVFSTFSVPISKKVLQQDYSFVNFPIVTVVSQPYVFSDFGMPKKATFLQSDFLDSPVPPVIQNYVFSQFNQPQVGRIVREGFTNAPFTVVDQKYIFSLFSQPISKRVLQVDQSFVNLPVVVTVTQPYIFTTFEQPKPKLVLQLDNAVDFQIFPPVQVVSVVTFTGFSDFGNIQSKPFPAYLLPSVDYDVLVPIVRPEDVILGGRRFTEKIVKPHRVIDTCGIDSSTIESVLHSDRDHQLKIKFKTGREYVYNNVDSKKVKGLLNAKSSGKYLHNNIKGKYFATRIK